MKNTRLSVIVANLRTERDLLGAIVGLTSDQIEQRISVLTQCIDRLEPNGAVLGSATSAPKVTRTRKPKPVNVDAMDQRADTE